jgi:uncharacterized membrane protein
MFNLLAKLPAADKDAHARSVAKAITWRLTGSIDTFVLSLLITGNVKTAGSISVAEVVTKILLFYTHERAWALVAWGKSKASVSGARQLSSIGADYTQH